MYDSTTTSQVPTFASKSHPHSLPWAAVYGRALVRPIAACMLPVMILTLVAVLEGVLIFPGLLWASGGALLTASAWTSFRLQREVAEIRISPDIVCVRTVWDVLNNARTEWAQVLDVRDYGTWAHVMIGFTSYEIDRDRWERYEDLVAGLKHCLRAAQLSE